MSQYLLVDGVRRNKQHAETFGIPSDEVRNNVPIGAWARVGFINSVGLEERMWVRVERQVNGIYTGHLDNDPVRFGRNELKHGDTVIFQQQHVLGTHYE